MTTSKKKKEWQLQEAKNKFSQLFEETLTHGVQTVSRRGKEKVLLIALKDYQKLMKQDQKSLSDFLSNSPLGSTALDTTRNKEHSRDIAL